jgi:hypothetical protein
MTGDMHKVKRASTRLQSSRLLKIVTQVATAQNLIPLPSDAPVQTNMRQSTITARRDAMK